ncbi:helix-turn-helix domain-containing protein [Pirellulaceae bacterium SH501]
MTKATSEYSHEVKRIREKLCLTQEQLAETLGVSFATVNRWENGWTAPSKLAIRQIEQLCKEHKIPLLSKKG